MANVDKLLYHLGKGLWKGIPFIGSVVEEVVYEAHREELRGQLEDKLAGLSDEQLKQLDEMMERAGHAVETALADVQNDLKEIEGKLDEAEFGIRSEIGSLKQVIEDVSSALSAAAGDTAAQDLLEGQLRALERQRQAWIARISATQRELLGALPGGETPAERCVELFERVRESVPELRSARVPELHFRLHELRWLGLIDRSPAADDETGRRRWHYFRTEDGDLLLRGAAAP